MYRDSLLPDQSTYLSPREVDQRVAWCVVNDYAQLWRVRKDGRFMDLAVIFESKGNDQVVDVGSMKTASDGSIKVYGESCNQSSSLEADGNGQILMK